MDYHKVVSSPCTVKWNNCQFWKFKVEGCWSSSDDEIMPRLLWILISRIYLVSQIEANGKILNIDSGVSCQFLCLHRLCLSSSCSLTEQLPCDVLLVTTLEATYFISYFICLFLFYFLCLWYHSYDNAGKNSIYFFILNFFYFMFRFLFAVAKWQVQILTLKLVSLTN